MKVLVTGGAGFIGSHLCEQLYAEHHKVAVIDNLSTGSRSNLLCEQKSILGDITSKEWFHAVDEFGPEAVVHLASQISVAKSIEDPLNDAIHNINGSLNVLGYCKDRGIKKFIFSSSAAVYGDTSSLPITEEAHISPKSPYGISKCSVERYLEILQKEWGIDCTILRFANVYGPRQDASGEGGVVSVFAKAIAQGVHPLIFGDGNQERDFVYVSDVARAILLALNKPGGFTANVSTGKPTSVMFLLTEMCSIYNLPPNYDQRQARAGDIYRSYLDNRFASEKLGWEPQTNLHLGLSQTLAWAINYYSYCSSDITPRLTGSA